LPEFATRVEYTKMNHSFGWARELYAPTIPSKEEPEMNEKEKTKELVLSLEELEERIAPSVAPGQLGYEGQPGNQGNGLKGYEGQPGNQGG